MGVAAVPARAVDVHTEDRIPPGGVWSVHVGIRKQRVRFGSLTERVLTAWSGWLVWLGFEARRESNNVIRDQRKGLF